MVAAASSKINFDGDVFKAVVLVWSLEIVMVIFL